MSEGPRRGSREWELGDPESRQEQRDEVASQRDPDGLLYENQLTRQQDEVQREEDARFRRTYREHRGLVLSGVQAGCETPDGFAEWLVREQRHFGDPDVMQSDEVAEAEAMARRWWRDYRHSPAW